MAYFVPPYIEEILYSQIARLFEHTLQPHVYAALKRIFKKGDSRATMDLPNNLSALFENHFYQIEDSPHSLIYKYTLFPYYEHFLTHSKKERILEKLLVGSGSQIHIIAGINSSKTERSRYPRYCPECLVEMYDVHKEPYWKRVHQIPGAMVCPIHNVFIKNFQPPFTQLNRSLFFPASKIDTNSLVAKKNKDIQVLKISKILGTILDQKYLFDINTVDYQEAIAKKFRYKKGRNIDYSSLLEDMEKYYGQHFLKNYFSDYHTPFQWVPSLVRRPISYFDPIKHVVLHNFLENCEAKSFLFLTPEWDGSWQCINGACEFYGLTRDQRAEVFLDHKNGRETALIKCECGMEYLLTYRQRKGKRTKSITIKEYGDVWKKTVTNMSRSGHSAPVIANTVRTCAGSIRRFLKSGDTNQNDLSFQVTLQKRRQEWISLLKSFDDKRIIKSREANNKLYKWLYNNDLNWLKVTNRLYSSVPRRDELRLNWTEIDDQLIARISEILDDLQSKKITVRITRNLISKLINVELNYFRINKDKLPRVTEKLVQVAESIKDFQIRKLSESLKTLRESNQSVTVSKALRHSNIRVVAADEVMTFLQNEIAKARVA